ncbi:MAG: hypothetical protein AABW63_03620 [Nanoarchaeota archaeon]
MNDKYFKLVEKEFQKSHGTILRVSDNKLEVFVGDETLAALGVSLGDGGTVSYDSNKYTLDPVSSEEAEKAKEDYSSFVVATELYFNTGLNRDPLLGGVF